MQAPAPRGDADFSIRADLARPLAPAGVQVSALVGPDADVHADEPSPADGKRLAQADLVLIYALGYEGWIERMVKVSGCGGTAAVASPGVQPRTGGRHDVGPHAWQDLALARHCAISPSAACAQRSPSQRDETANRQADQVARIDGADRRIRGW